jgi:hypothetical protein
MEAPLPHKKEYSLIPCPHKKEDSFSFRGLAQDPLHPNPMGRNSHLFKAQQRAVKDIHKGKQETISRAFVGNTKTTERGGG